MTKAIALENENKIEVGKRERRERWIQAIWKARTEQKAEEKQKQLKGNQYW